MHSFPAAWALFSVDFERETRAAAEIRDADLCSWAHADGWGEFQSGSGDFRGNMQETMVNDGGFLWFLNFELES